MGFLASIIDRHAKLIIAIALAATIAMFPGLKKIRIVSQPPENTVTHKTDLIESILDVKKSFGANSRSVIISIEALGSRSIIDPPAIELIKNITTAMKQSPVIRRDSILSLATLVNVVNTEDGFESVPLLQQTPQNFFEEKELKDRLRSNELIWGRIVSTDFKTTLIVATGYEDRHLYAFRDSLKTMLDPLTSKESGYLVMLAGDIEINYLLETNIQKDAVVFILIAIAMILISFYFMFKTWKGVVIPLVAVIIGIIWTMGFIGYKGEPISIMTAMLPVMLVITGSAYAIHVFHALDVDLGESSTNFRKGYRTILQRLFWPLGMSMATTAVGGLTLLSFKFALIQQFGVFMALGACVTFLIALIIIPALYKAIRKPVARIEKSFQDSISITVNSAREIADAAMQIIPVVGPMTEAITETATDAISGGVKGFVEGAKKRHTMDKLMKGMSQVVIEYPWYIISATLILIVFSVIQMQKVTIGFDNLSVLPNKDPVKDLMYRLDKTFNGIQSFDLMLSTHQEGGVIKPDFLKQVDAFSKQAAKIESVTQVFSVLDILKRVDRILRPEIPVDGDHIPPSADAVSQYILLLSSSSSGGLSSSSLVTSDYRKFKMRITTNVTDTNKIEKLYLVLQKLAEVTFGDEVKIDFGGSLVGAVAVQRIIIWGKIQNIFSTLLVLILMFVFTYRSFTRGLLTIVTLPVGVLANFGIMGLLGIRLDMITAIITSFAMGMGVDFTIHCVSALRDEYVKCKNMDLTIERTLFGPGKIIIYNALSTIVGFSSLFFSKFSVIHTFAVLMCFNMVILALGAITLVPAVVKVIKPEFITDFRKDRNLSQSKWLIATKVLFNALIYGVICYAIYMTDRG